MTKCLKNDSIREWLSNLSDNLYRYYYRYLYPIQLMKALYKNYHIELILMAFKNYDSNNFLEVFKNKNAIPVHLCKKHFVKLNDGKQIIVI